MVLKNQVQTVKARVAWELIVAIIVGVITIAALGVSIYQTRYGYAGVEVGKSATLDFNVSGTMTPLMSISPSAGNIKYGMNQTVGTNLNRYSSIYKEAQSSSYTTLWSNGYFSSNNTYYGLFNGWSASAYKKYNFGIQKTTGTSYNSRIECDLVLCP